MDEAGIALVARARRGDATAFAELYRRFRPLVRGVLLARLSPADADDTAQEVFVTAHRKIGQLHDDHALPAWLCTIARSKAVDLLRTKKPTTPYEEDVHAQPDAAPPATDVIAAKERAGIVLRAIQSLPEAYKEPLVLRLVEGLSGPEIAAQTGLTEGSVRINLHRGMALLKSALALTGPAR